ncbi:hypothetical protein F0U61_06855 [Archangium violaceum]|uniref:hypothetical protein n=1 Tax=Archangium violaceum TaxID=83451 RepID=UPI002B31922D|nr:hypothetical protein F0U61_06855 [Archangium violaceum]
MTLKTLASAVTVLLTLSPLTIASAQSTTDEVYVFEAVDSYDAKSDRQFSVTGIIRGEPTPKTIDFDEYTTYAEYGNFVRTCERLSLMAMSKPGQYLLEVRRTMQWGGYYQLTGCRLTRR